jgi:Transcription factor e(y)2
MSGSTVYNIAYSAAQELSTNSSSIEEGVISAARQQTLQKLKASGDYDRLKQRLLAELLTGKEWLQKLIQDLGRNPGNRRAFAELTQEEMRDLVVAIGRDLVPCGVKPVMIQLIQHAISKQK